VQAILDVKMGLRERLAGLFGGGGESHQPSAGARKAQIKMRYLMEAENLEKAIKYDSEDILMARLAGVVRDYFCETMGINTPMTLEEISGKLKNSHLDPKVKDSMMALVQALSIMEYSGQKSFKSDIRRFLMSFKELIQAL